MNSFASPSTPRLPQAPESTTLLGVGDAPPSATDRFLYDPHVTSAIVSVLRREPLDLEEMDRWVEEVRARAFAHSPRPDTLKGWVARCWTVANDLAAQGQRKRDAQ